VKILWVKANKLLPVHSGGDIRSFNILRHLAERDQVVFFSYYDGARDSQYESELEKELPGSVCVCTGKRQESTWARGVDYLMRLPDSAPYAVSRFASVAVQARLRACLSQNRPDVVICDFLDAAINLPFQNGSFLVPSVLFQHNVESEIWRRHAENGSGWAMRLVYRWEASKMLRYEQTEVRRFNHVIAVSEHDKKLMSAWVAPERVSVVPTGVDTKQFRPSEQRAPHNALVVFVGAMDWEPNVDAVKYFCAEIWPQIREKVPDARFRIVGRSPDRRVQKLAGDSIEVTGRVRSVVEHLREAAVVVVPLRIGGGTRLKIYEAMAAGKAVVSTSVGAEGLDVHHGEDSILADTTQSFAEAVVTLLCDDSLRRRYEEAAARLASQFDWSAISERFAQLLKQVSSSFAPHRVVVPLEGDSLSAGAD
jgi:polysaccharide biosynthesis protein PslH